MKKLGIWSWVLLVLVFGILPVNALGTETETVAIPVQVLPEGEEYTVVLEAETAGAPMPEGSDGKSFRLLLKGGETGEFLIPCDRMGVFDYCIRELPGEDPGCTYDSREYRLRLYVTAGEDGRACASALLYGQEGRKEPAVLFRNRWAEPVYVTIRALKTLDGNTPEDGAFTFRLLAENGEVLFEEENKGRRVTFPALRFDAEGTYRFFLKEKAGKDDEILYDRAVYTIQVEVTKDTDYRAQVTYLRNGKPYSGTPAFANYTDTGSPKTGDDIGIYAAVLVLSAGALGSLLAFRRKKR